MPHDTVDPMQDLRQRLRVPRGTRLHAHLSQLPNATARNQELLRRAQNDVAREEAAAQPACGPWCAEMAAAVQGLTAVVTALLARLQDVPVLPGAPPVPAVSASPLLDEADPFEGIDDIAALNFRTPDSSGA